MMRRVPLTRKTGFPVLATSTLKRTAIKRRAPKKRAGHEPKYLAACRGEACFLSFPGCTSYPKDPTVVHAHQNQGKGMGLKVPDRFTVPACHHCHTLYDQSGLAREYKRAAWDWAYTRWSQVRDAKMRLA